MSVVILKPGREKSLNKYHPWVFSGAIAKVKGKISSGQTVEILNSDGGYVASGAYSPESQIRVRVWTWEQEQHIDESFFRSKIQAAITYRKELIFSKQNFESQNLTQKTDTPQLVSAYRLVHAESDGLPGLIVDLYNDTLVIQVLSAGPEKWRETIVNLLSELTFIKNIYERSDVEVRRLEGLTQRNGPIRGKPSKHVLIEENGLRYKVAIASGHKTGFYLDQRENRIRVRKLAAGKEILDCFSYTGGFTINSLVGGASAVTTIDVSAEALKLARDNVLLNQLPEEKITSIEADVFQQLRKFRDRGRQFDMIILDPPKFAPTASLVKRAARGYKDINLLAFKLLRPGGKLVTFSCSGGISPELFQKIIAGAAEDAGIYARIVDYLHQSPDHPVALNFPEGAYLKGFVIQVLP